MAAALSPRFGDQPQVVVARALEVRLGAVLDGLLREPGCRRELACLVGCIAQLGQHPGFLGSTSKQPENAVIAAL